MKPRNREINIFNLSMMDVISGAMGAFLILVVILSRHYQSTPVVTETVLQLQRELAEATGHLDQASREVNAGSRDPGEIERFLRQAKDNVNAGKAAINELRNELDVADARIRRLDEQVATLQARIEDLDRELSVRRPFYLEAEWSCDAQGDVDIYLQGSLPGEKGTYMPPFQLVQQWRYFSDELYVDASGQRGAEIWLYERAVPGNRIKVFYKLDGDARPSCTVRGYVFGNAFEQIRLPESALDTRKPWLLAGTLTVDDDHKVRFAAATEAESRAEAEALRQRTPSQ